MVQHKPALLPQGPYGNRSRHDTAAARCAVIIVVCVRSTPMVRTHVIKLYTSTVFIVTQLHDTIPIHGSKNRCVLYGE